MPIIKRCDRCRARLKPGELCECHKKVKPGDTDKRKEKEADPFYCSGVWQRARQSIFSKYSYLDLLCLYRDKRVVRAELIHHIVPLKEDRSLGLSVENLIPLSRQSHAEVEAEYSKGKLEKQAMQAVLYGALEAWRGYS